MKLAEVSQGGWSLFLDDERFPPENKPMKIARTVSQAIALIDMYGAPSFVSFDHDLGYQEPTGYDFAKWLVQKDLDSGGSFLPSTFYFDVHSQNPVGAKNIWSYLGQYLDTK